MDFNTKHARAFYKDIDDPRLTWVPPRTWNGDPTYSYIPVGALVIEMVAPKFGSQSPGCRDNGQDTQNSPEHTSPYVGVSPGPVHQNMAVGREDGGSAASQDGYRKFGESVTRRRLFEHCEHFPSSVSRETPGSSRTGEAFVSNRQKDHRGPVAKQSALSGISKQATRIPASFSQIEGNAMAAWRCQRMNDQGLWAWLERVSCNRRTSLMVDANMSS